MKNLEYFFRPKSLAVVGASDQAMRPGNILINNLVRFNYKGKIYPVNPKCNSILGLKTYARISEIPGQIELVFSLLGIDGNLTLLEECSRKGVKGMVVAAGGYSDSGLEGRKKEEKLVELAHKYGIRIIGPNTVGYSNPYNDFILCMIDLKQQLKGNASFICQTGQFATNIIEWFMSFGKTGISQCIDLGNKSDVDDADVLEYLSEDPNTFAIGIYTENLKNGRRFMDTASRISKKIPIVVFKTGRTKEGARVSGSHTGALAADDTVINAAIKQAGLVRAYSVDELLDMMRLLSRKIRIEGNRVGIVTNTGAGAIMSIDTMEKYGLQLAELTDRTKEALKPVYTIYQEPGNPVDIGPAINVNGAEKSFEIALRALDLDPNVDCILLISIAFHSNCFFVPDFGYTGAICKSLKKPVIGSITGSETEYQRIYELLEPAGVLIYQGPEAATVGIGGGYQYTLGQKKQRGCNPLIRANDVA
jgi:acyl-CoA synthetase (NDP forming)